MSKTSNIETYQLIADILSFKNDSEHLAIKLKTTSIDWEHLVVIASKHLVLTTVYCRLQQQGLLKYLPQDLIKYLEELTSINRNRNQTLIKEAKILVNSLEENTIEYTFLKGMALLLGGYYKDLGERMIGDFDILVAEKDLKKTVSVFKELGYTKFIDFNYKNPNFRHLPRQVDENKLAAIEVHRHILNPSHRHLIAIDDVFKNKRSIHNSNIPSIKHLNIINILASELNDHSYFYNTINFKTSYDSLVLDLNTESASEVSGAKYILHYMALNSTWFHQFKVSYTPASIQIRKRSYLLKIKYERYKKCTDYINFISHSILMRLKLVLNNKNYGRYLIESIILRKLRPN